MNVIRLVALLALCPLLLGAGSVAEKAGRVIVLGIDSLDPEVISLLSSEGKLPNLTRLARDGSFGRLRSSRPILSPIIWTTIATGKDPTEHGIGDFTAINQKTGDRLPVTSQMRQVKALWNILSGAGKSVGIVGWWATWPAESVDGVLVSDHTCYHFLFEAAAAGAPEEEGLGLVHPPERVEEFQALVRRPDSVQPAEIERFVSVPAEEFDRPFAFEDDLSHFKWAWATAESYRKIGLRIWKQDRPDLLMVYIEGVDSSSHLFGHLFRVSELGGEMAAQQQRFGKTVEAMYEYADELIGQYMAVLGPEDTLMVVSDHGFELGALPMDPSKTRDMRRVSAASHRIDGVIYLYGKGVVPGSRIQGATLVDVTPTILALEGIAPAKDMPGRVLGEALRAAVPERTRETFETSAAQADANKTPGSSVDPAILARLEALGYLETKSPRGKKNLAAVSFEEGNFEASVEAYREQLEKTPNDPGVHTSLAGVLGSLERYDEALVHLGEALRLDPISPMAYHNRAVIYERRGNQEKAIAEYRKALRYGSGYGPSRQALIRLTGSADLGVARTEEDQAAAQLAQRASLAARKGRYEEAMGLLDRAERVAPNFAMVYQYRANVAFLMGNRSLAEAALERAVALEPDNPLFQRNLKAVRPAGVRSPAPGPTP